MRRYAGLALAIVGVLAWICALGLTFLMSQESASLLLIPALPVLGIAGDVMVVCGLAMMGLPALVRRREQLTARISRLLR